jgi:soluble lytic murein transglycosylase
LQFPPLPAVGKSERAAFAKNELAQVVEALGRVGVPEQAKPFLNKMIEQTKSPVEHHMIVELAAGLGRDDLTVATAKSARAAGTELLDYLFPLRKIAGGDGPEKALVLAVIRQESAFQADAISSAGARGLMQLMPATAKHTAKRVGLAYSPGKLNDPTYNIALGRAYLGGLLVDYNGSYVLSLAGYNAGPRRVMEWMGQNRDPRRKGVDVIDWVESIPISETRNYVQRVLENLQVYRHRLGGTQLAVSLEQDLAR